MKNYETSYCYYLLYQLGTGGWSQKAQPIQGALIKTHGSESRGQEEAASARPSRPRGHYSE